RKGVAQSKFVARLVVLALNRVTRAAGVEAEHRVSQIESGCDKLKSVVNTVAGLGVHLRVLVQVNVAERAMLTEGHRLRRGSCRRTCISLQVRIGIAPNVWTIIRNAKASREASPIVSGTEVKCVGSLPLQGGQVGPEWNSGGARGRVAVV